MTKIHYHSDCSFFAGCENMLVNFLQDEQLNNEFELSFSYRYSPEYFDGLRARVTKEITEYPSSLICEYSLIGKISKRFYKPISTLFKIIYVLLPIKYLIFTFNFLKMRKILKKIKPDIIHINNGGYPAASSSNATVIAARSLGITNIIYMVNNMASTYKSPIRWFDYPIDFFVKNSVRFFITGSTNAGECLKSILKLDSGRVIRIPNGIAHRELVETKSEVLERLGVDSERMILGLVALFEERKGHKYLINAFVELKSELKEKCPILLLEGHGALEKELKELVRDNHLSEDILFVGSEKRIFDFINSLDVFILPSIRNEDFPNVILEAMSLKKAVIGTQIAGIPEQIDNNLTGILIRPASSEAINIAIKTLAGDYNLCRRMGDAGQIKFNENYSVAISISKYKKLYNELLKNKRDE